MHCFNSLIRPLKFNKRHLTANSQDVRVLIEIWGTPERGVMLNCKRLPRPVIWGLGRTCQQGWCDSSSTSKRELPQATKAFSSVLRHVTSLTFYSFLGFLFPHLFVISTVRRGGEIPKGNECVGQQANLPRALCRCARVQHPCSYRKPEHKPGERDSHPQSKNNRTITCPSHWVYLDKKFGSAWKTDLHWAHLKQSRCCSSCRELRTQARPGLQCKLTWLEGPQG